VSSELGPPIDEDPPNTTDLTRLFERDLELRAEDIKVRVTEIERDRHEIDVNAKLSEQAISAQLEAERLTHSSFEHLNKSRFWLIGFGMLMSVFLIGYALWIDKETVIIELIKLAGIALGAGLGGYAYGYHKGHDGGESD
jgi:N-methylhydantoinase A/oxoprolinase/acetone carboxylase beta subunit